MIKRFYPKEYVKSIFHVDYESLKRQGINCLVFDIDNTIEPYDIPKPAKKDRELLLGLVDSGFKVCLVSNNSDERVKIFNESLKLPAVSKAKKPLKKNVLKMIDSVGANKEHAAFIGDQVFTDVWCANRIGLYSILVNPIATRDEFSVRLKRGVEKKIIDKYLKSKNINT